VTREGGARRREIKGPDVASATLTKRAPHAPVPIRRPPTLRVRVIDLDGADRERSVPVIKDGFVGVLRWHAKRTMREVPRVRAAVVSAQVVGVSLLERLVDEVGYVHYIAVLSSHRRQGIADRLLEDALRYFRREGAEVVFAAADEGNVASQAMLSARGFRPTARKETSYRLGGLGGWGLRCGMGVLGGERLFGLRLRPPHGGVPGPLVPGGAHQ
jgi:ribosomal protein S18 acetylase RimI-like enzyme